MNDPIVDEVRAVRDSHASRFNYDLDAIFSDIQEQQRKSGLKFVSYVRGAGDPNVGQPNISTNSPLAPDLALSPRIPAV